MSADSGAAGLIRDVAVDVGLMRPLLAGLPGKPREVKGMAGGVRR
jgi:hypothetical protein